jgi:hypothetical protein
MTTAEVVAYVRKELDVDDEHLARVITSSSVDLPRDAHSGVTLDLSHKNIKELPVEVSCSIAQSTNRGTFTDHTMRPATLLEPTMESIEILPGCHLAIVKIGDSRHQQEPDCSDS